MTNHTGGDRGASRDSGPGMTRRECLKQSAVVVGVVAGTTLLPDQRVMAMGGKLASLSVRNSGVSIYVSPLGDDVASGTAGKPVKSLERARGLARAAKQANPNQTVTVWLHPGRYVRSETFSLSTKDSGAREGDVVYRAMKPSQSVISMGRRIEAGQFKPVTDREALARLDGNVRGKVVELDLRKFELKHTGPFKTVFEGGGGLFSIYHAGERMPMSRFPDDKFLQMQRVLDTGQGRNAEGGAFMYYLKDAGLFERLKRAMDGNHELWLKGYWRVAWQTEAIRIQSIDTKTRTVRFAGQVRGGIGSKYHRPHGSGHERYWLLNAPEAITVPGEWAVDFRNQKMFFYPPKNWNERSTIEISDLDKPVVRIERASDVKLEGLVFEYSQSNGIEVNGGHEVKVAGCVVRHVDQNAVVVSQGKRHRVESCDLYDLGAGGVTLSGGSAATLPRQPAEHHVINNHIHHFARLKRVYAAGVNVGYRLHHADAVGMVVKHNLIHDTPHVGVLCHGWDHVFEYNEVFRYCMISNDMGAFYSYAPYSKMGNQLFRYNLMHSSPVGDGLYWDIDHRQMTVHSNIVWLNPKNRIGIGILYKIGSQTQHPQKMDCQNNVVIKSHLGIEAVAAHPAEQAIEGNVLVDCQKAINWEIVRDGKRVPSPAPYPSGANASFKQDPGFVNMKKLDFRLKPGSTLLEKLPGFKPIPVDRIGLYRDQYRRSLPTNQSIGRFDDLEI